MKATLLCLVLAVLCVARAANHDDDHNVLDARDEKFEPLQEKFHKMSPILLQLGSHTSSKEIVVVPSAKPGRLATPKVYMRFKKSAFKSGNAGYVSFAKLSPGSFRPLSDHRIRVDTTTEAGLQTLSAARSDTEVVVKFAKVHAAATLVKENDANKCLKHNMRPAAYQTYVADYLGSFFAQCIEVKSDDDKKLKKVGSSADTKDDIEGGTIVETSLPTGVCSYLIFANAGTSHVKRYLRDNLAHMDFAARLAFGRRVTQAYLALLDAGFLHGDAHMKNLMVDANGENPKWIDISGLKPVRDGVFAGSECTTINKEKPASADAAWYTLYGPNEQNGQDFASLNKHWGTLGKPEDHNFCINKIHKHLRDTMDAVPNLLRAVPRGQHHFADFAALQAQVHAWYDPILDANTDFTTYAPTQGCTTA